VKGVEEKGLIRQMGEMGEKGVEEKGEMGEIKGGNGRKGLWCCGLR